MSTGALTWRRALWLFVVLPLALWQVVLWSGNTIDDAGITFAYVDTWLRGGGLAFRPGDAPVEAYTNALWLGVLTPFAAVGLDLEVVSKVLGFLFAGVASVVAYRVALRLAPRRPWAALVGPLVLWGAPLFGFWVLSGLENGLFAMLLVLGLQRALDDADRVGPWRSYLPTALVQCGILMTRPDGILYVLALQAWTLARAAETRATRSIPAGAAEVVAPAIPARRERLRAWALRAALGAGLYLLYFIVRYSYFRQILPNSFIAKSPAQSGGIHLFDLSGPGWSYVRSGIDAYALTAPLLVAAVAGLCSRRTRTVCGLVLLCYLAGLLFPLVTGGDWMFEWRFLSLGFPLVALLLAVGTVALADLVEVALARWGRALARQAAVGGHVAAAVVMVALALHVAGPWEARAEEREAKVNISVSDLAQRGDFYQYVAELAGIHTPLVADADAGGITWKRRVSFLDLGKLGDLSLARHHPRTYGTLRDYVFHEVRPQFIHLHGAWYDYKLQEMDEWEAMYAPISRAHTTRYAHVFEANVVAVAPFTVAGPVAWLPAAVASQGDAAPTPGGRRAATLGLEVEAVMGDLHHGPGERSTWGLVARAHGSGRLPPAAWVMRCEDVRGAPAAPEAAEVVGPRPDEVGPQLTGRTLRQAARPTPPHAGLKTPITWAAGLFDASSLAHRAWVTGVVSTPLPTDLDHAPCLALVIHEGARDLVVAVSTPADGARASLAAVAFGDYLARLGAEPALLLRDQASPVAPAAVRVLCASLGLVEVGACHRWLRDGVAPGGVRAVIEAAGVERARAVLGGAADGDVEALVGAALWLIAAREAAGTPPMTEVGDDLQDLAEELSARLLDASYEGIDPLSDEAIRRLDLARRTDPASNRPRLAMEARRLSAAPPVRGIEWKLRQDLLEALQGGAAGGAAARADDARAYVASAVRAGRPLEAWRCLDTGPCTPFASDPAVRPWGAWLEGLLGLGPRAPEPATARAVWGFEGGSLHGMTLSGAAFGPGPETKPLPGQQRMSGYEGEGFLDSFHGEDGAQGVAESQPFVVEHDFVGLLVGGGRVEDGVRCELVIDGEAVLTGASPRRSATLNPIVWDLRPYRGKVAVLRLVDGSGGTWAHLLVDAVTWLR